MPEPKGLLTNNLNISAGSNEVVPFTMELTSFDFDGGQVCIGDQYALGILITVEFRSNG